MSHSPAFRGGASAEAWAIAQESADFIKTKLPDAKPQVAIICGSGLGVLANRVLNPITVMYEEIPNFPATSVHGHVGELIFGSIAGVSVVLMRGRFHYYEGLPLEIVTLPVRVFSCLGVETLVVTNACGGINTSFKMGDVMLIRDHLNIPGLGGFSPLIGPNDNSRGQRFVDTSMAYSARLKNLARECAKDLNLDLKQGVFCCVSGPSYETPSEINALRVLGADAVCMSTAAEVVAACHAQMRCVGFSTISNVCFSTPQEDEEQYLKSRTADVHSEVLKIVEEFAIPKLISLLEAMLARMATESRWAKDGQL